MMNTINNKYLLWYYNIIDRAKCRVLPKETYTESHHIIPLALGGLDVPENKVKLLAREHYICHLLLTKFLLNDHRQKMLHAWWMIANTRNIKVNSKLYSKLKSERSKIVSEKNKNTKQSPEWVAKRAAGMIGKNKGKKHRQEWVEKRASKIRGIKRPEVGLRNKLLKTGTKMSEEQKLKIRITKNAKKYNFYHPVHGSYYINVPDLCGMFPDQKLDRTHLRRVGSGFYKQCKGWTCPDVKYIGWRK
jgi:hypothetical protein